MRLFIAITLNEEIKDYLSAAIEQLKSKSSGGGFTHRENLHLTLVFLGEVSAEQLGAVKSSMNRIDSVPFPLSFSGFGKFKRRGGDIHWAGVKSNEALFSLQKQLRAALQKSGFSLEERAYAPHLTLGRKVHVSAQTEEIYGTLADEKHEMPVFKISLMKSERINGKLVYTEIYQREL